MRSFLFVLALLLSAAAFSQSPSKLIKEGKELQEQGKWAEAIAKFSAAIDAKSSSLDAYEERARCYMQTEEYPKAVDDCKMLVNLKPKRNEYKFMLAKAYLLAGKAAQASETLDYLLGEDLSNHDYYEWMIRTKLALRQNDAAGSVCNEALSQFPEDHFFIYLRGVSLDSTRNNQLAVLSYQKALQLMEDKFPKEQRKPYWEYYRAIGISYLKIKRFDNASGYFNSLTAIDTGNYKGYELQGDAHYLAGNLQKAVDRFSRAISRSKDSNLYFKRGMAYKAQKQFTDAMNDFNKLLAKDSLNIPALLEKANCCVELGDIAPAKLLYGKVKQLDPYNKKADLELEKAKKRYYENNRETEKPEIKMLSPESEGYTLLVPVAGQYLELKGVIYDKSNILSVIAEGVEAKFDKEATNPEFTVTIPVENKSQLVIKVTDVYYNTTSVTYSMRQFEKTKPKIILSDPIPSSNMMIYVGKTSGSTLKLHGHVDDESQIKSVKVNGMHAEFSLTELSPEFSIDIPISNTDSVIVEATDAFDNTSITRYSINRKAITESDMNPMGITWFVFIENSSYLNFATLDGPAKDCESLKKALSGYRIDNFIVKKNMNKEEMERFFAIELRQQLKSAQVNSLVVWYAGHGKFQNDNGYWIPVNAKMNDEFSYFQITNLKGYISTYKFLSHILVISDACETGGAFCIAENNPPEPGDCLKADQMRKRSAQVFTSSNVEKSADNSMFAGTFSDILLANSDPCLPIEKIRNKVTKSVTFNQAQKPMFGHIAGVPHDGGSFYFIRIK
jgi:tetratricopeptide (TPR) repeat protein